MFLMEFRSIFKSAAISLFPSNNKNSSTGNARAAVIVLFPHDRQIWVFFLPLTLQRKLESSHEKEIWHEFILRNSTFNGNSLTSLADINVDI